MNAELVLTIIGGIMGLMGILGIAYAVFRSATVQKTLDLYRSENEALGKALARQQADLLALTAKAEELERANGVLQRTVSGTTAIEALKGELARYQTDRAGEHQKLMEMLGELREQMGELWRGVVRLLGEQR